VSTRAIPYGHQNPAGLRNGLWPVHIILLRNVFHRHSCFALSFYHSFCSWLALRYYGEVALVADVAECRDATYEAFSPPQTPTAFCLNKRRKRKERKEGLRKLNILRRICFFTLPETQVVWGTFWQEGSTTNKLRCHMNGHAKECFSQSLDVALAVNLTKKEVRAIAS